MDNMQNKIQEGLFSLAPDCFDEIMARTPIRVESEEELFGIPQESSRKEKSGRRRIMSFVSAVAVLFLGIFSWSMYNQFRTVDQLYIDVNPSVCLSYNKSGKITKADGINPEGEEIIRHVGDKIKKSSQTDAMVDTLLNELDSEGYFREGKMEILLSYCYTYSNRQDFLDELAESTQTYADEHGLEAIILVQSFSMDDPAVAEGLAKGISPGKCYLLNELEEKYQVNLEDFESLSLNDLMEYAEENNFDLSALVPESGKGDYASLDTTNQEEDEENSTEEDSSDNNSTVDSELDNPKDKPQEKKPDPSTADKESQEENTEVTDTTEKKAEEKKAETKKKTVADSTKKKTEKKKETTTSKKKKSSRKSNQKPKEHEKDTPPVTPDKPSTPDKPDVPDEPDIPTPAQPDEPDEPDTPDKPDEPDEPDKPDPPDEPDTPDTPDEPDEPHKPDEPDKPDDQSGGSGSSGSSSGSGSSGSSSDSGSSSGSGWWWWDYIDGEDKKP